MLAVGLFCVFHSGCDTEPDVDPNSLIGMSKGDVLRLVFERCPKNANGEINIGTWEIEKNGKRSYMNFYYKSLKDAADDTRLMGNDIWEILKKERFSVSILTKVECLDLFFEKGVVVKVEKNYWYNT